MVIAKSALESNALCVEAAVDYLLQLKSLGIGFFHAYQCIFPNTCFGKLTRTYRIEFFLS